MATLICLSVADVCLTVIRSPFRASAIAPALANAGLVCDALFTDYNNDDWPALLLAGEWMPLTFLKNVKGRFVNETAATGIANKTRWWNSLSAGDFDNDGDMDYIAGNLGLNSYLTASGINRRFTLTI